MSSCQSPFFIWFTGRTGSTYLCDLLDSHPDIYCRKEDFSEIAVADPKLIDPENLVQCRGGYFFRRLATEQGVIDHPNADQTVSHLQTIFNRSELASGFKLKFPNQSIVFPEVIEELIGWP
ncbi:MAG: hypothetical protein AAGA30_04710, partial [Planctomycetota bacterium]